MAPATRLNDADTLFIPLVSDYGFKVVFGNERNTLIVATQCTDEIYPLHRSCFRQRLTLYAEW